MFLTAERLLRLRREPLAEQLAVWLVAAPSAEDVAAYAERDPSRWAQGLAILTKASGYSEKNEIQLSGLEKLQTLPDSELMKQAAGHVESVLARLGEERPGLLDTLPAEARERLIRAISGHPCP